MAHTRPGPEKIPIWTQRCVAWFACTAEVDQASKVPTDAFLTLLAFLCRPCALLLLFLWVTKDISPSLLFVAHEICSPLGQSAKFVFWASNSPPKYCCNVWLSEHGFCTTCLLDAAYLLTRSTVHLRDSLSITLHVIRFMILNTSALITFAFL